MLSVSYHDLVALVVYADTRRGRRIGPWGRHWRRGPYQVRVLLPDGEGDKGLVQVKIGDGPWETLTFPAAKQFVDRAVYLEEARRAGRPTPYGPRPFGGVQ